jgi:hypothetical protein
MDQNTHSDEGFAPASASTGSGGPCGLFARTNPAMELLASVTIFDIITSPDDDQDENPWAVQLRIIDPSLKGL